MSCGDDFIRQLRLNGLRLTPQRKQVLLHMHDVGHPASAEEIHKGLSDLEIELSTVYRTLDLLSGMNLVTIIDKGDKQRLYELVVGGAPHLHLVCRKCGEISSVDVDSVRPLLDGLSAQTHFQLEANNLTLAGICESCRDD